MTTQFFGKDQQLQRSDLVMIRSAIAKGWDVPTETKLAIMCDVVAALNDESAGARLWAAAADTLICMEHDNDLRDNHDRELRGHVETARRWLAENPLPESKRKPRRPR